MHFSEGIHIRSNFKIVTRERGKLVPKHCIEEHNIWVDLGREFLPQVVSPGADFSSHMLDDVIGYMGFGIGGNKQIPAVDTMYPAFGTDYPGLLSYDKGTHDIQYLERPIKVTGTAGWDINGVWDRGDWAVPVATPPTLKLVSGLYSTVEFITVVTDQMTHLSGSYPAVPISEAALMLHQQPVIDVPTNAFYLYGSPPAFINPTRPTLVAYNNFGSITKTTDVTLEFRWQLQF